MLGNQYLGTGTKWCYVHTLSAQYVTDCVHSHSISPCQTPFWNMNWVARTKQWTARNLQKLLHTGTRVHFCVRAQDRDLALEHRHRARILARVCLEKECVHIGAQWVPYLDTVIGYHVWTLPKWMNVTKVSQKSKVTHPNKFQKQLAGLMRKTTKLNIRRLFCLLGEKRPTKKYSKQYEPLRG